ncbi:hypothetical protein Tco_0631331 [Tanacetum coccineum]
MAGGSTVKEMTTNFQKLDKFEGHDFRPWHKKMHFLLTNLKVVYVLTTMMPELLEDDTVEAIRREAKWENNDYICRGHILYGMSDPLFDIHQNVESVKELWDSLESKYMWRMLLVRSSLILGQYTQHGLKMEESIYVSSVIDKLPPSWKDFKHSLKHGKDDLSLVQLGSHLRIEESPRAQESNKGKGKEVSDAANNAGTQIRKPTRVLLNPNSSVDGAKDAGGSNNVPPNTLHAEGGNHGLSSYVGHVASKMPAVSAFANKSHEHNSFTTFNAASTSFEESTTNVSMMNPSRVIGPDVEESLWFASVPTSSFPSLNEATVPIPANTSLGGNIPSTNADSSMFANDPKILFDLGGITPTVFEEDGLGLIATYIGKPIMLDSYMNSMCHDSQGRSSFARCLIEVNSEVELLEHVTIDIPSLVGYGFIKETIHLEYEWKPLRCDTCKIFGHTLDCCPKKVVTAPVMNNTNNSNTSNDGFQQVVNKKRNNNKSAAGNKIPKGIHVAKGFQVGKEFNYQPKAYYLLAFKLFSAKNFFTDLLNSTLHLHCKVFFRQPVPYTFICQFCISIKSLALMHPIFFTVSVELQSELELFFANVCSIILLLFNLLARVHPNELVWQFSTPRDLQSYGFCKD